VSQPLRTTPGGFSLIELVGVIAVTAVIMNVSIALLYLVTTWGTKNGEAAQRAANRHRFEHALRSELADATAVTAAGVRLTIETPRHRSQWILQDRFCLAKHAAGEAQQHERFAIGSYSEWQLQVRDDVWELTLARELAGSQPPLRVVVAKSNSAVSP